MLTRSGQSRSRARPRPRTNIIAKRLSRLGNILYFAEAAHSNTNTLDLHKGKKQYTAAIMLPYLSSHIDVLFLPGALPVVASDNNNNKTTIYKAQ